MASVFRIGIARLASPGFSQRLCKASRNHNAVQVALISSRVNRLIGDRDPKPPPFPYWEKDFEMLQMLLDPMLSRFDENTKLIVVDGPPAVGKSAFAKTLAEKLDMLYMPPPTPDDLYVNPYGVDFRKYNDILPHGAQCVDFETFNTNPYHKNIPMLQWSMYHMRFEQYIHAMLHMLSTGQGVVLNRCVYSDKVFFSTMYRHGYISKTARKVCRSIQHGAELELCRPHLVIYLDASVSEVQANIKKRNIPYEVNSKVLTTEYLSDIETQYREYLQDIGTHSYTMVYDWQSVKDVDWIVHDIERLDIDGNWEKDKKLADWDLEYSYCVINLREMCSDKFELLNALHPQNLELPDEFYYTVDECTAYNEIICDHSTEYYDWGFNPEKEGASKILRMNSKKMFPNSRYRRNCRDFVHLQESLKNFRKEIQ